MSERSSQVETYRGFELGPIRPPSEAASLLLRVTRNCPWNKCKFCGLYRGETFSIRPVDHLKRDIDLVRECIDRIQGTFMLPESERSRALGDLQRSMTQTQQMAFHVALNWLRSGMQSVFLQDANTLVVKAEDLVAILEYLREVFPMVKRVTCYARSHSAARLSDADMARLAAAGLNRIHIGMESGADAVLAFIRKGVDQMTHIAAGQKIKRAGIELSEYYMPGLGGQRYWRENALETAAAMNAIDPDYIRIRTLAIPPDVELYDDVKEGGFRPLNDMEKAAELLLFLEHLEGINSVVKSDHILNLFQEVEGALPGDSDIITAPLRHFISLSKDKQLLYLVGRRTGIFTRLSDLDDAGLRAHAERALLAHRVSWDNVDDWTAEMMQRFI